MRQLFRGAVVALLMGLAACTTSASPDVTKVRDPASVAAGAILYEANCERCHGVDLAGGPAPAGGLAPSLASRVGPSDALLTEIIKRGRGFQMPAFATQLADGEIASIVDYVRSVQAEQLEE